MKKYLLFIAPLFCLMVFLFGATSVSAANYGLSETAGRTSYKTSETPTAIATKAINAVLAVVYIIFFVLVLYAGIRWMTAQGNEENVTKAKNILEAAIIGVVLISAAYAVTSFVLGKVGDGGGAGGGPQTNKECNAHGGICMYLGQDDVGTACSGYSQEEEYRTIFTGTKLDYFCGNNYVCCQEIESSSGATEDAIGGCGDGKKNGDESDVDCGGSCAKCTAGKSCRNGSNDCQGVCYTDNKCRDLNNACCIIAKGSCIDVSCTTTEDCEQKCNNQKAASVSFSFSCIDPILDNDCRVPQHCSNNTQDGDETMKDCGGSCRSCDSYTCCRCTYMGDDKKYWYLYQTASFNRTTQPQYVDDYCVPECKKLDTRVNRKWDRPCLQDGGFPIRNDPNSSMYSY